MDTDNIAIDPTTKENQVLLSEVKNFPMAKWTKSLSNQMTLWRMSRSLFWNRQKKRNKDASASGVDKTTPENSKNPILLWVVPSILVLHAAFIALHIRIVILM